MTPPGGTFGAPGAAGKLDVGAALSYGWAKFTQYIGQIIIIVLVLVAINVVGFILRSSVDSLAIGFILNIAIWVVSLIVQLGIVRIALEITAGRQPDPSQLFKTDQLGPYIIASILFGIGVMLGLIAFCIGAVIVAFLLWYYPFFILDKNEGPTQSLGSSFNMVKSNAGELIVLTIAVIALNFISCGLLAPMSWIAAAYAYRTLNGQPVAP